MASASCVFCRGLGLRKTERKGEEKPCGCVFRAIFKACFQRYRYCLDNTGRLRPMVLEMIPGPKGLRFYGRKNEEFIADFDLISKRVLSELEQGVLEWYFRRGQDWKVCTEKLGINRAKLFYTVYAVQEKLGKAFRETAPYALFPLDEYFQSQSNERLAKRAVRPAAPAAEKGKVLAMPGWRQTPLYALRKRMESATGGNKEAVVVRFPVDKSRRAA